MLRSSREVALEIKREDEDYIAKITSFTRARTSGVLNDETFNQLRLTAMMQHSAKIFAILNPFI